MHCSSEAESSGIRGPSLQPDVFFVRVCKRSQSNRNHGSCFSSSTAVELSRPNAYQLLTPCQDSYKGQAACAWLCSWWRSEGMRKQNHPAFFVTHTIYFFFFFFSNPRFQPRGSFRAAFSRSPQRFPTGPHRDRSPALLVLIPEDISRGPSFPFPPTPPPPAPN